MVVGVATPLPEILGRTDPVQWLKCYRTQGNAVPAPPIYGSKRSPIFRVKLYFS